MLFVGVFPVFFYIGFCACKWSAKAKIAKFLPDGVSLPHTKKHSCFYWLALQQILRYRPRVGHLSAVDQSQRRRPANQSEQIGLWFQTEGEQRCCSTGSMRKIKSFFNIKSWRHVTVETQI